MVQHGPDHRRRGGQSTEEPGDRDGPGPVGARDRVVHDADTGDEDHHRPHDPRFHGDPEFGDRDRFAGEDGIDDEGEDGELGRGAEFGAGQPPREPVEFAFQDQEERTGDRCDRGGEDLVECHQDPDPVGHEQAHRGREMEGLVSVTEAADDQHSGEDDHEQATQPRRDRDTDGLGTHAEIDEREDTAQDGDEREGPDPCRLLGPLSLEPQKHPQRHRDGYIGDVPGQR